MPTAPLSHTARRPRLPDSRRGNRGYGERWRRLRLLFLHENPVCVKCNRPATDVDHVNPISGPSDERFFDMNELQALCHSCHSIKTAKEDGGFGHGT
jgi:5-methylcytosine-specific restriction enzyme A